MIYDKDVIEIPNHLPDSRVAQYMLRNGKKQYNLCGEICCAYSLGVKNIDHLLNFIQEEDIKFYSSLFPNGISRTTSVYDLDKILRLSGVTFPLLQFSQITISPESIQEKLQSHIAIVGVKIDNWGYLVGSGIGHWVVLIGIIVIDDKRAICDVYNPFTNQLEAYSWRELMTSTGVYKRGLWVEK